MAASEGRRRREEMRTWERSARPRRVSVFGAGDSASERERLTGPLYSYWHGNGPREPPRQQTTGPWARCRCGRMKATHRRAGARPRRKRRKRITSGMRPRRYSRTGPARVKKTGTPHACGGWLPACPEATSWRRHEQRVQGKRRGRISQAAAACAHV